VDDQRQLAEDAHDLLGLLISQHLVDAHPAEHHDVLS
jgi:hypothetical protein